MAQTINTAYKTPITSSGLNDKINTVLGNNGVLQGFNIISGTGKTLSLVKSNDSISSLVIKGAVISESADIANSITIADNVTGANRIDTVYAKYNHGTDAACTYGILSGTQVVPDNTYCKLAEIIVPTGFAAASSCTINNTPKLMSNIKLQTETSAALARETMPSGFTKLSDLDYVTMSTNPNQIKLTSDSTAFVNGYKITIPSGTAITLNAPPTQNSREDLVFLEVWLDQAAGLPNYRIRVVDGVDFTKFKEGLPNKTDYALNTWDDLYYTTAQGGSSSPVNQQNQSADAGRLAYFVRAEGGYSNTTSVYNLRPLIRNLADMGLYLAGNGDDTSKTALKALDGYVYAVPMFRVKRRANTGMVQSGEYKKVSPLVIPIYTQRIIDGTNVAHLGDNTVQATINGNTLVNLLGTAGNCEDLSKWTASGATLDTSIKLFGAGSSKLTASGNSPSITKDIQGDNTHKYLVSSYAYISSYTSGICAVKVTDYGAWSNTLENDFDTAKLNQWQRKSLIVTGRSGFRVTLGTPVTSTLVANIDGAVIYDLTAKYGAGNEPSDIAQLERDLPFVDGVASSKPIAIKSKGKNLAKVSKSSLTANGVTCTVDQDGTVTLNGTATGNCYFILSQDVMEGNGSPLSNWAKNNIGKLKPTTYTASANVLSGTRAGNTNLYVYNNEDSLYISLFDAPSNPTKSNTYTTERTLQYITVLVYTGNVYNNYKFNIQIEEGSSATAYAPYKASQVVLPSIFTDLKKIGSVSDKVDLVTKTLTKNISDWITLDGSKGWNNPINYTGFKRFNAPVLDTSYTASAGVGIKHDGTLLNSATLGTISDTLCSGQGNNSVYITVSNTDSGFVDSYSPSSAEISAYFYGWKMCMSDGGVWDGVATKYWKKITDGTGITATLPIASYVGYTPYKMIYQLATPVITDIKDKLKGNLYVNGGNENHTFEIEQISTKQVTPIGTPNGVTNGDFSNGTTGWAGNYGTLAVSNSVASVTGDASSTTIRLKQATSVPYKATHKYYFNTKLMVTDSVCSHLKHTLADQSTANAVLGTILYTPLANQLYNCSSVITTSVDSGTVMIIIDAVYPDSATQNGKVLKVQQAYAVDLTAMFGAGNEPSQSWCDQYLAFGTNYVAKALTTELAQGLIRNNKDVFLGVQGNCAIIPANKYQSGVYELLYKEAVETSINPTVNIIVGAKTVNTSSIGSVVLADTDVSYKKIFEGSYDYSYKMVRSIGNSMNTKSIGNVYTITLNAVGTYFTLITGNPTYYSLKGSDITVGDIFDASYFGVNYVGKFMVTKINSDTSIDVMILSAFNVADVNCLRINSMNNLVPNSFSNIVIDKDITPLAHSVSLTGYNYDTLLKDGFNLFLKGQLY